jgi:prephenate dehydrogenase
MVVGVYGLGRFGSFWAELLSSRCEVRGWSRNAARPTPPGVRRVDEVELLSLPAVFLCTSISSMEEVLARIGGRVRPGSLVMDTCSVKIHPVRLMEQALPPPVSILGTHPLFGPDSARDGVRGLPMILCPARIGEGKLHEWEGFFGSLGLDVRVMSPEEHDRQAANTQGITHYVGRVLADFGIAPSTVSTLGYRKLLEIVEQTCNDPWQLFLDLQRYNPHTREMRVRLKRSLERVMGMLENGEDAPGGPESRGVRNRVS